MVLLIHLNFFASVEWIQLRQHFWLVTFHTKAPQKDNNGQGSKEHFELESMFRQKENKNW